MSGTCSRCGAVGEMTYGGDGLSYCSSCSFYGLNKQCYRCRMYLPASELQQYKGQLVCPYCLQDSRAEDRRSEEHVVDMERPKVEILRVPEQCERCGRDLEGRVYIWNGRKLCKHCLDDEKNTWGLVGGGPMGPVQRIRVDVEQNRKKTSLIEHAMSELLYMLRLKKRPVREVIVYSTKMHDEIGAAKPLAEKEIMKDAGKKTPQVIAVEGLMESKKPLRPNKAKAAAPAAPAVVAPAPKEASAPAVPADKPAALAQTEAPLQAVAVNAPLGAAPIIASVPKPVRKPRKPRKQG